MTKFKRNKLIESCHNKGKSQKGIGEIFNLSQSAVSHILKSIKGKEKDDYIETRGVKNRLTEEQKKELITILKKDPSEYGFFLWNKWSIQSIIKTKFEVSYHQNYIYKIMQCINFTSQKPATKDYRQNKELVKEFKEKKVVEIKKKMTDENRTLLFQDEAAVRLLPSISNTYAPIGETPTLECDVKNKEYVSIAGVISEKGDFYFEVREKEGFKQRGLTRFLDHVKVNFLGLLGLIWDNASSHKSETVKEYLRQQNQKNPKIWLANIPPHSPELNPIELLWGVAKKRLANYFVKNTKELKIIVTKVLNEIKEDRELIKSFFKHKELECYQFFS